MPGEEVARPTQKESLQRNLLLVDQKAFEKVLPPESDPKAIIAKTRQNNFIDKPTAFYQVKQSDPASDCFTDEAVMIGATLALEMYADCASRKGINLPKNLKTQTRIDQTMDSIREIARSKLTVKQVFGELALRDWHLAVGLAGLQKQLAGLKTETAQVETAEIVELRSQLETSEGDITAADTEAFYKVAPFLGSAEEEGINYRPEDNKKAVNIRGLLLGGIYAHTLINGKDQKSAIRPFTRKPHVFVKN